MALKNSLDRLSSLISPSSVFGSPIFMPTWSADDDEIVYASSRDNYESLWSMHLRSGGVREVVAIEVGQRTDGVILGARQNLSISPRMQQAIRYAIFQVVQASARAEQRAIPAKGLTSRGYDGHSFWDMETYTLPVLTYVAPDAARDAPAHR